MAQSHWAGMGEVRTQRLLPCKSEPFITTLFFSVVYTRNSQKIQRGEASYHQSSYYLASTSIDTHWISAANPEGGTLLLPLFFFLFCHPWENREARRWGRVEGGKKSQKRWLCTLWAWGGKRRTIYWWGEAKRQVRSAGILRQCFARLWSALAWKCHEPT